MSESHIKSFKSSCVPHHNTITATGESHFCRVSDALAEFVDNSIQACQPNEGPRNIGISFFLRKTRGKYDEVGMSKFGVGARQAGFYLGDRLRVITRASNTPGDILETILDKEEFERRFGLKEDVYTVEIKGRPAGDTDAAKFLIPVDESKVAPMQELISKYEEINKEFTMIIIRLKEDIVAELTHIDRENVIRARYNNVSMELAEIYHFYLHPEHRPLEIVKLPKFKDSAGLVVSK